MKFDIATRSTGWLGEILRPGQSVAIAGKKPGQVTRQGLAVLLSALMIMIPMGQGEAFAQSDDGQAPPPAANNGQQAPQGQPLSATQLDQLVAPIALYPDALVAQVLAAATYPTQVVEADRWRQAQGDAPAEQIAAGVDSRNWDPSVKALTAFPTVLAQMDRNIQWTTDLGNAYYNQPQDVMDSVQAMRQKAQTAGQLRSTPQQTVNNDGDAIAIAPANPAVVYVPVYDPWAVYGSPFPMYPGYYYGPPAGIFWGGLAIGFGVGVGIGVFSNWGWGWGHWGMGWRNHSVYYNRSSYFTRSSTVINRGFSRPGGPGRGYGARGAYSRPGGGFNRGGGNFNRPGVGNRGANGVGRPGVGSGRSGGNFARPAGAMNRPGVSGGRSSGSYGHSVGGPGAGSRGTAMSRGGGAPSGASRPSSGGRPSGGGHSSGGGPSGGGHASGGGPSGGGGGHSSGGHPGGGHEGHGR